jgi:hypothetical protein
MRKWWAVLAMIPSLSFAYQWEVEVGGEFRAFLHPALEHQARNHPSVYAQPEAYMDFNNGDDSLFAQLFYRLDRRDSKRSHGDIRELNYTHAGDNWEVQIGLGKVFWGVAESRHLVDIINQTDVVENIDEEDKLGQPMVKASVETSAGTLTGFILPYFRERTFAGSKGRPRTSPVVDTDLTMYESTKQKKHLDWALRWSHSFSVWDVGASVFHGTSREPRLIPTFTVGMEPKLAPLYDIISQYSIDAQATIDSWLLKFEGYRRTGQGPSYNAMVTGFEYTLYGLFDSTKDLGLIAEYHYDSRNRLSPHPYNDDIAAGFRLAFNDAASSELLAFVLMDRHSSSKLYRVEASRRLGDSMTISLEGAFFDGIAVQDPLFAFRQEDFIQLNLVYHFSN